MNNVGWYYKEIISSRSRRQAGCWISFWSPNHQLTNMLVQALMMVVAFLSPVMVEIDQLPSPLQWLSYIFPTTYAADAMRNVLLNGWSRTIMEGKLTCEENTLNIFDQSQGREPYKELISVACL
ncbi:ABC transporter permease [Paenibacillus prosopidis]|uniref:ABC transporter permease n=1 Tax=Paenibacillus prosopidis TaxID=630520 RepID=UPI003CCC7505